MANTVTLADRTGSKNILATIFLMLNVMGTILGLFVGLHASAHHEYDWGIFFSLLTALNAVVGLMISRNR
jgi:hypothetical protein